MHLPPCYTRMTRSHDFDGSRVFDGIDLYGEEKTGNHTVENMSRIFLNNYPFPNSSFTCFPRIQEEVPGQRKERWCYVF